MVEFSGHEFIELNYNIYIVTSNLYQHLHAMLYLLYTMLFILVPVSLTNLVMFILYMYVLQLRNDCNIPLCLASLKTTTCLS